MKHTTPALVVSALLSLVPMAQSQVFTNPDFSEGWSTSHPNYSVSDGVIINTAPDGWNLFNIPGIDPNTTSPDWISQGSSYLVMLDSYYPNMNVGSDPYVQSGISQEVSGFALGEFYQVGFDASTLYLNIEGQPFVYGQPGYIDFYIDGVFQESISITSTIVTEPDNLGGDSLGSYSVTFQALSESMELGFRSRIASDPGEEANPFVNSNLVTNFSVTQVPEPSGAMLFAVAGALMLLGRNRLV